jgi:CheY-like chemotaxis protein
VNTTIPRTILAQWDVLVVEDEADSLDVAFRVLRYYGATVHIAHNGREALDVLKTITPKFILSDLSMPTMSGWELIEHINRDQRLVGIPIIALTSHAMQGDREKAISKGFYNYLTKPLTAGNFIRDLLVLLVDVPSLALEISS